MVGSFVIGRFGEDLDEGFVLVAAGFEVIGVFGGMSRAMEEKLAEGN